MVALLALLLLVFLVSAHPVVGRHLPLLRHMEQKGLPRAKVALPHSLVIRLLPVQDSSDSSDSSAVDPERVDSDSDLSFVSRSKFGLNFK